MGHGFHHRFLCLLVRRLGHHPADDRETASLGHLQDVGLDGGQWNLRIVGTAPQVRQLIAGTGGEVAAHAMDVATHGVVLPAHTADGAIHLSEEHPLLVEGLQVFLQVFCTSSLAVVAHLVVFLLVTFVATCQKQGEECADSYI